MSLDKPTLTNTLSSADIPLFTHTIDSFSDEAKKQGYPFFTWNQRVYAVDRYYTHHQFHDICLASELK